MSILQVKTTQNASPVRAIQLQAVTVVATPSQPTMFFSLHQRKSLRGSLRGSLLGHFLGHLPKYLSTSLPHHIALRYKNNLATISAPLHIYTIYQSIIMPDSQLTRHFQATAQSDSGPDSDETARKDVLAPSPPLLSCCSAGPPPLVSQSTVPESQIEHGCPDFQRHNDNTHAGSCAGSQQESSTGTQEEKHQETKTVSPPRNHANPGTEVTRHSKHSRRQ